MQVLTIIGSLGADAKFKTDNGREYIQFSVAHNERITQRDGTVREETSWVSCFMNGRQEKLLPYLVKGQKVVVMGRMSTRIYSSEKLRKLVAGVDINVDRIELIGGQPDNVPKTLFDKEGVGYPVTKHYLVNGFSDGELFSQNGTVYKIQGQWVVAQTENNQDNENVSSNTDGELNEQENGQQTESDENTKKPKKE